MGLNLLTFDISDSNWIKELILIDTDFTEKEAEEISSSLACEYADEEIVNEIAELISEETESQHVLGNKSYTKECDFQISGDVLAVAYYTED